MARVRLDRRGVGEMLRSGEMADGVGSVADRMAVMIRAEGHTVDDIDVEGVAVTVPLPVDVSSGTTDRVTAAVTLDHPAGLGMQAKHGVLTRAASALGLDVTKKR